jgi:threonylcarbamoyladenosine tRNA methylthiotransferase MtaB
MSKDPEVVTFGCRLNVYESEVMKRHAKKAGLQDAIIFNTCAVTKEAERQARQSIRRARRENPDAKIIVTGCSAQVNPKMYSDMGEVDVVLGNDLKLKEEFWLNPSPSHALRGSLPLPQGKGRGEGVFSSTDAKIIVNDIMSVKETAGHLLTGYEDRSRAFIQVQNGCDHRCTFCIIPYGRGNSRSVPIGVIVEQVRALVVAGYKEIVMSGVDITSYGPDLPGAPTLGQMIRRVLVLVPDLPRLRLSSLDPVEIDDDLWRLIAEEPRFMPHLHLSLQAGDDLILKRMKRRHLRDDVIKMCERARSYRPDIAYGADIIAGFPTESEEMFQRTMDIVEECGLTFLHVFPYSEREGTPAAKMPSVDKAIRKERAARLRGLGEKQVQKFLYNNINKDVQAIVEKGNIARAENFAPVEISEGLEPGSLVRMYTTGIKGSMLTGDLIS